MMAVTSLSATSGATEVGTDGASQPALRSSSAIAAVATHIAIDAISSSWNSIGKYNWHHYYYYCYYHYY